MSRNMIELDLAVDFTMAICVVLTQMNITCGRDSDIGLTVLFLCLIFDFQRTLPNIDNPINPFNRTNNILDL